MFGHLFLQFKDGHDINEFTVSSYNHVMIHGEEPGSTQCEVTKSSTCIYCLYHVFVLDPKNYTYPVHGM